MDPGMLGWTLKLSVPMKTELIYSVLEKEKSCFVSGVISLSRSSTGKSVLLICSVFRYILARQSGPMNVFSLHCHVYRRKLLISVLDWHKQVELTHCFMMPTKMHNKNQWGKLSKLWKHESWATHSIIFLYAEQALNSIWSQTFCS